MSRTRRNSQSYPCRSFWLYTVIYLPLYYILISFKTCFFHTEDDHSIKKLSFENSLKCSISYMSIFYYSTLNIKHDV